MTDMDLAVPQSDSETDQDYLPIRMLNEYTYCPRLFHLMHVEGRWEDNEFTLEGKQVHRRVDRIDQLLPDPEAPPPAEAKKNGASSAEDGDAPPEVSRSVSLTAPSLGITGKLDLVSTAGDEALPVETKRGRVPNNSERSWEPERVQLMAQGLLLRENGYRCTSGVLYFAASRTRVDVPFRDELEQRTRSLIAEAHRAANSNVLPPPLEDSPKCNGCSLSGICLPDETLAMRALREAPSDDDDVERIRRLFPPREATLPFYIQEQGAKVGKKGQKLIVNKDGEELASVRVKDVSQVVLMGGVGISTHTVHFLCEEEVPIVYVSRGHWFYGITHGIGFRNAYDRAAQFQTAGDESKSLEFARAVVLGKGSNQRTILGRNISPRPISTLKEMSMLLKKAATARTVGELLGLEGGIAARYFAQFGSLLKPRDFDATWDFSARNRRPPKDPVNALLSFGYALLTKDCTVALLAEGLDPWWGMYHRPRHGRPALALDLMEEFRPLVVDSAVLTAVNTGMVTRSSFQQTAAGCMLTAKGRKDFIRAYEARLDQLVTHPVFDYRCSWRSVIRVQARLISRWLRGDVPSYQPVRTR